MNRLVRALSADNIRTHFFLSLNHNTSVQWYRNLKPPGENYFMSSFYWYFQFILIESSTIILLTLIRMEKAFIELDTDFLAGKWQSREEGSGTDA